MVLCAVIWVSGVECTQCYSSSLTRPPPVLPLLRLLGLAHVVVDSVFIFIFYLWHVVCVNIDVCESWHMCGGQMRLAGLVLLGVLLFLPLEL